MDIPAKRTNTLNKNWSTTSRAFAVFFSMLIVPAHTTFAKFQIPDNEHSALRTRCIGYNTEAEAAIRFREGRGFMGVSPTPGPRSQTHRVAVILAEFPADDDELTTGSGRFGDLPFYQPDPDNEGQVVIDTTINSRSRAYYSRHLLWMAQYFSAASEGQFTIADCDTLVDVTPIVELPNEMTYYGDNSIFGLRQTEFVRDAIVAADTLSDLDFSLYDAVLVFHAGAGEESDFGPSPYLGDSPDDLFSSYIPFEALRTYVGEDDPLYQGVETTHDDSVFYVRNAIILPETIIQDTQYNPSAYYLDIFGIMCHEYAHELGLPDLNDTDTPTRPAVGNFGLMSSGLFNSSGRLPAHPIGWCKLFLGWEDLATVTIDSVDVVLKGIELPGEAAQLVRVPISSSEYFLLENRLRDSNFDGEFTFDDFDGDNWPDLMDDDYQLPDGSYSEFDFGLPGILTTVPGRPDSTYDNPLLGSGVMIWHIDDEVIRNNFDLDYTENCVNCNASRPGIDLEEADGIQHLDDILPATIDPGYGSPFDLYGGGVVGIKDDPNVKFSRDTSPSSSSYTAGATGITISGFRALTRDSGSVLVDSLVAVDVNFTRFVNGWPVMAVEESKQFDFNLEPGVFEGNGICAADIDGDGEVEVSIITRDGSLFLWGPDGTNFPAGDRAISPFYSFQQPVSGNPALGDLTGDGKMEIVVAGEDGSIYALWWSLFWTGDSASGMLEGFPAELGESVTSAPLLVDLDSPPDGIIDRVVVGPDPDGGENGKVFCIKAEDGSIDWQFDVDGAVVATPAAGDIDRVGEVDVVVTTSSGHIYRLDGDGNLEWDRTASGESFLVSPSLADIDRNGVSETLGNLEIVTGSATTGRIYVYTADGQIYGNVPIETGSGGEIKAPVCLADIDQDGFVEVIALVDGRGEISVHRSNTSGTGMNAVDYFPKVVSSSGSGDFFSPPVLADLDGNGEEEIIFGTADNIVYAYDLSEYSAPSRRFPLGADAFSSLFAGRSAGDTLAVFAADERGMVYGWQLDELAGDVSVSWGQEGHDSFHTSMNGDALGIADPETGPFTMDNFWIYPNPVRSGDDNVTIRYKLDESVSRINLDIYTVSGRRYPAEILDEPPDLDPGPGDKHWVIKNVPSGVYLVRLEVVRQDGSREHLIKKAAVVK